MTERIGDGRAPQRGSFGPADLVGGLIRFALRLVLLAAGLLFALSLLAVVLLIAAAWGLRALWARITGRPVAPWTVRIDPRAGLNRVYRSADRWTGPGRTEPRRGPVADVTDVEAKERPARDE